MYKIFKEKGRIMKCPEKNLTQCNCTYPCDRKGICCDCIAYHRKAKQLPACYFSESAEKTYDRSIENYVKTMRSN